MNCFAIFLLSSFWGRAKLERQLSLWRLARRQLLSTWILKTRMTGPGSPILASILRTTRTSWSSSMRFTAYRSCFSSCGASSTGDGGTETPLGGFSCLAPPPWTCSSNPARVLRGIIGGGRRHGKAKGRFRRPKPAAMDMLKQSGESLAGRISYLELDPFDALEINPTAIEMLWVRGGFPRSFLAESDDISLLWRRNFVRTYLERDISQFGPRIQIGR